MEIASELQRLPGQEVSIGLLGAAEPMLGKLATMGNEYLLLTQGDEVRFLIPHTAVAYIRYIISE